MKLILGKWLLKLQLKKYIFAEGIGSGCSDGKHVLLLDFDDAPFSVVEASCRMMQGIYGIGTCWIFKTAKNSFHVITITKFTMEECLIIMNKFLSDINYIALCFRRGYFTLRVSEKGYRPKPILHLILHAPTKREISSAHAKWLSLLLGKEIKGSDGLSGLRIDRYATFPEHPKKNAPIRFRSCA